MSIQFDNEPQSGFEGDLARSLAVLGAGFETDPVPLISGGMALGRRARRRRRRAVLAGVAVAAVVAGAVAVIPHRTAVAPAAVPVDPRSTEAVMESLRVLLPGAKLTFTAGTEATAGVDVGGTYDDGHGLAGFSFNVMRVYQQSHGLAACSGAAVCQDSTLADGSKLRVSHRAGAGALPTTWGAQLLGADGRAVSFYEFNAPDAQGTPVTRPEPPLSLERLAALVTAPVWGSLAMAVPADQAYREPAHPSGQQVLDTLTPLLPKGLRIRPEDLGDGRASLTADDGRGQYRFLAVVEDTTGQRTGSYQNVLGWQQLPDGTWLYLDHKDPSGGNGVTAQRTDGLRVTITVTSFGPDIPLTADQLQAIALSPAWHRLLG